MPGFKSFDNYRVGLIIIEIAPFYFRKCTDLRSFNWPLSEQKSFSFKLSYNLCLRRLKKLKLLQLGSFMKKVIIETLGSRSGFVLMEISEFWNQTWTCSNRALNNLIAKHLKRWKFWQKYFQRQKLLGTFELHGHKVKKDLLLVEVHLFIESDGTKL